MDWPDHISREAILEFEKQKAFPYYGWILAHWRGWAWLRCDDCGWFLVSESKDLVPFIVDHWEDPDHEVAT